MLTFRETMGGYEVLIDGKQFGWISKENGFFTDPTAVKEFIKVSPSQLMEIAKNVELIKQLGYIPFFLSH